MSEVVVRSEGLGKRYRRGLHLEPYRTARDAIASLVRNPLSGRFHRSSVDWFWALQDVSFDVSAGESVGLVGRNGAGKTTLLKLLSRVTTPTTGLATINGRVGSLLEVGAGFHLELTGRENVKLNGAVLGLTRREIAARFDDIVEFAGVGAFIDTPVKRFSAGMYMRLAFSVAAHLDPDILIVDEVLSVGDAEFQKRCLGKLGEVGKEGRTVIFVSHNMAAVRLLCDRGLLFEGGKLELDGPMSMVIDTYLTRFAGSSAETHFEPKHGTPAFVTRLANCTTTGQVETHFASGEDVVLEAEFHVGERLVGARLWAWLYAADGTWLIGSTDAEANPSPPESRNAGSYRARFAVPKRVLNEGSYQFRFAITRRLPVHGWEYFDDQRGPFFEIEDLSDYSSSDLGKRRSVLLVPMEAAEERVEREDLVRR